VSLIWQLSVLSFFVVASAVMVVVASVVMVVPPLIAVKAETCKIDANAGLCRAE